MKVNGNELNIGNIIRHKDGLFKVVKVSHVKPGKGGAYAQTELKEIRNGMKLNERFRSAETVERIRLDETAYTYLYESGGSYSFMNTETFDQIELTSDTVGETSIPYLYDGMEVMIASFENEIISVIIPEKVECIIAEADAVVKGQTASSSYKPAVLENGISILVPPHITAGTKVVINTTDNSYIEKVKD